MDTDDDDGDDNDGVTVMVMDEFRVDRKQPFCSR